jgi:hypothetical protein
VNKQFEKENVHFFCMDLTSDSLPNVDLVIVRDCFVHLSYLDIKQSLHNIFKTSSKFLLTTTFPNETHNIDIISGQWRPINLQLPPFKFPEPEILINEGNPDPLYQDKSIGLWKIDQLKTLLVHELDI